MYSVCASGQENFDPFVWVCMFGLSGWRVSPILTKVKQEKILKLKTIDR